MSGEGRAEGEGSTVICPMVRKDKFVGLFLGRGPVQIGFSKAKSIWGMGENFLKDVVFLEVGSEFSIDVLKYVAAFSGTISLKFSKFSS